MKRLLKHLHFLRLTPFLLSLSFVIVSYNKNIDQLNLGVLFYPLFFVFLAAFVFTVISRLLFLRERRSTLFASSISVIFFVHGSLITYVPIITALALTREEVALIIEIIAVAGAFLFLKKSKRSLSLPHRFLFLTALITFFYPLFQIASYEINRYTKGVLSSPLTLPSVDPGSLKSLPDIYFIMPEDYSSGKVMNEYYHTSTEQFEFSLKKKGFYIASDSASNYTKSFLTVASSLNLEYLDYLSKNHAKSSDQGVVRPLIQNNNVLKFLKSLGYSYYHMGSWWDLTTKNPYADANFSLENENRFGFDEFSNSLIRSTILRPIINRLSPQGLLTQSEGDKRKRIIYQFEKLPEVAALPGPKFVFAHIIAPHPPYVFDEECRHITYPMTRSFTEEENYSHQAVCINTMLLNMVTKLQEISERKAIIMIVSDEGAPFLGQRLKPDDTWKKADRALLVEKFPILSAYFFPGKAAKKLYPTISPVNTFRLLFNQYFSTDFPLLPDRQYIFPDLQHLYDFQDVTDEVGSASAVLKL